MNPRTAPVLAHPCGALGGCRKQALAAAWEQEVSIPPRSVRLLVLVHCSYKAHYVYLTEKELLEKKILSD